MHVYDTLIIGCGYGVVGYAAANKNTMICEEHQICDTGFYLPLRTFQRTPYTPKTAEGKALQDVFDGLDLFNGDQQNANEFEFALCKYISEKDIKVLLKCRVIGSEKCADGILDETVHTNEGLSHILTKQVLNSVADDLQEKRITILFTASDYVAATDELLSAFPGASVETAFYEARRALHIPVESLGENLDENTVKLAIYQKWNTLTGNAKILYIAPVFYGKAPDTYLNDGQFNNPIEAFENGWFYAEKEAK